MKAPAFVCVVVALLALCSNPVKAVTINFSTDTATRLIGSFSATGDLDTGSLAPANFIEIPSPAVIDVQREPGGQDLIQVSVGNPGVLGTPDNPRVILTIDPATGFQTFSDVFGTYNNGPNGLPVNFLFSNLQDTGGTGGTWSGDFEFVIAGVPDAGSTALLMALALGGLGIVRKRMR